MAKDKKNRDEYPKLSETDKQWKEQEEFNSAGLQRQLEDEDKNNSLPQNDEETLKNGDRS